MYKQLQVTADVHEKLKKRKAALGLSSIDAVIQQLLEPQPIAVEDAPVDGRDGNDGEVPARRRRRDVREPLYSLDILDARRGMLEYYTGFDRPAVELLIRRIEEASLRCGFCRFALMRCHAHTCVRPFDVVPIGRPI